MGGKYSKLEATILELEGKMKKEDNNRVRYELRRKLKRKIAKLQNKREDEKRRRDAFLPAV